MILGKKAPGGTDSSMVRSSGRCHEAMSTPRMKLAKSADLLDCSRGRAYPLQPGSSPNGTPHSERGASIQRTAEKGPTGKPTRLVLAMVVRRGNAYTRLFAESL